VIVINTGAPETVKCCGCIEAHCGIICTTILQFLLCLGVSSWAALFLTRYRVDSNAMASLDAAFSSYGGSSSSSYGYSYGSSSYSSGSYSSSLLSSMPSAGGWSSTDVDSFLILGVVSAVMAGMLWIATFVAVVYFCNQKSKFWRMTFARLMILDTILSVIDIVFIFALVDNGLSPMGRGYFIQGAISNLVSILLYMWWFSSFKKYADCAQEA